MPKELDVVLLKDGRTGTILEQYKQDNTFLVEIADSNGKTIETPLIKLNEIETIIYVA